MPGSIRGVHCPPNDATAARGAAALQQMPDFGGVATNRADAAAP
jgi:hypothetical protein